MAGFRRALTMMIGTVALAGCGAAAETGTSTTVTQTSTVTVTVEDPKPQPSETTSLVTEPVDDPPTSSSSPVITGTLNAARKLTLSDIFQSDGWTEGSIAIPKVSGFVPGISKPVSGCGDGAGPLEFRFADQGGTLVMNAAQGLESPSSEAVLEFKLTADGRLVDSQVVKFNSQATLETPLRGVSAVILTVTNQSRDSCDDESVAVLTRMEIQP